MLQDCGRSLCEEDPSAARKAEDLRAPSLLSEAELLPLGARPGGPGAPGPARPLREGSRPRRRGVRASFSRRPSCVPPPPPPRAQPCVPRAAAAGGGHLALPSSPSPPPGGGGARPASTSSREEVLAACTRSPAEGKEVRRLRSAGAGRPERGCCRSADAALAATPLPRREGLRRDGGGDARVRDAAGVRYGDAVRVLRVPHRVRRVLRPRAQRSVRAQPRPRQRCRRHRDGRRRLLPRE